MASPVLNHMFISGNIFGIFRDYLKGKPCKPIPDGAALFLSETEQYIPDMMVVCDLEKMKTDGIHGAPDLVVEILSPSTGQNDRSHKKDVYERSGVREYWIVSPSERSVEQYVLTDGQFVLRGVYYQFPDWMLKNMKEEERAAVVHEFKCSLFDDLLIPVDEIFYGMIPA